jgi:hypothetical protein
MHDPMKKRLVLVVTSIMLLGLLLDGVAMNLLLNLLIAGVIPGTHVSIPYWAMMTVYCLGITAVIAWVVERHYTRKSAASLTLPDTSKSITSVNNLRQAK